MSEAMTIEVGGERRRRAAPERGMTETTEIALVEGEEAAAGTDGVQSPEEALAEAQRIIAERNQQLGAEQAARTRAEREAQRQQAGRAQDRGAALAAVVEASVSAQAQARQALRAARESGDIDEEIKATEALSQATYRLDQANAQIQNLKVDPTSAAGAMDQPQQQGGVSQSAQSWIDRHPRFNSDPSYKATLMAVHYDVVKDGVAPDSPAYFRALDAKAAELDAGTTRERNAPMAEPAPTRAAQFNGASPTRGSGAPAAGGVVKTLLGPVTVGRRAGGKITVQVPPHLKADFEEGAKISGMSLGDYIYEQVRVAEEREAGGDGGLITDEGRTFR